MQLQPKRSSEYFAVMLPSMIGSIALLWLSHSYYPERALMAIAAGCAPMAAYHLFYLTPLAKRGASQAAIDSVYYFGFLITLFALGLSATTLALTKSDIKVQLILNQFGIGLLATGYAIVARLHVSSISSKYMQISPEEVYQNQIKKSLELVDAVALAVTSVEEFSRKVDAHHEAITARLEKSSLEIFEAASLKFAEAVSAPLNDLQANLLVLEEYTKNIGEALSESKLYKNIDKLGKATAKLEQSVSACVTQVELLNSRANNSSTTLDLLSSRITNSTASIDELANSLSVFVDLRNSVANTNEQLQQGLPDLISTVRDIGELKTAAAETIPTFSEIRKSTTKANEVLFRLSTSIAKLSDAAMGMSTPIDSIKAGQEAIQSLSDAAKSAEVATGSFIRQLASLSSAVEHVTTQQPVSSNQTPEDQNRQVSPYSPPVTPNIDTSSKP